MYVPSADEKRDEVDRTVSKPSGFDALRDEIEQMKDELAKRNRDQLDAMYNLDLDNFSGDVKRLFASYGKNIAEIKVQADNNGASIEAISKYFDGESEAFSGFKSLVTSGLATTEQFSSFKTNMEESYSAFITEADGKYAKTSSLAQYVTESELSTAVSNAMATGGYAKVESMAEYVTESGVSKAIADVVAGEGFATTSMIAEVRDDDGNVTAASIAAKVKDDKSLILAIADEVKIEGTANFVTKSDLATSGATTINGNNVYINLPFDGDLDEETKAESELNFTYDGSFWSDRGYENSIGRVYTKFTGSDSLDDARFALVIESSSGLRHYVDDYRYDEYDAALKLVSARGMSLEAEDGVYINGRNRDIQLDSPLGTRIRAYNTFEDITNMSAASIYDYVFASDGIYYNGDKIVSTSGDIIIS